MRIAVVVHTVGRILRLFSLLMLVPLVLDLAYGNHEQAPGFGVGFACAFVAGEAARRLHRGERNLSRLEGLAVVALTWFVVSLFAAIPYRWAGLGVIDAGFEAMSGLTTTGATVFRDFSLYSEGVFLWRAMTQWLGGMGVIALFIAILPALAIAGRQLFFAEAPGPDEERLTPRIRDTAMRLWGLYVLFTAAEVMALWAVGMPLFDAVCNSFTTLAAGGFSPHPQSIVGYGNPAAEWVFIVFMFIAGANYTLWYRALRGKPLSLVRDEEFRVYVVVVVVATLILGGLLYSFSHELPEEYVVGAPQGGVLRDAALETLARQSSFQVLTILTTTGFASDDFALWSHAAQSVLLVLMFLGGCAGSAAGGPKLVRLWLVAKFTAVELFRAVHPSAVRPVRLGRKLVSTEIMQSIVAFFLLYLVVFSGSVVILIALGADMMTGITASIATLGNIGPGFSSVGPMASYAHLNPLSKIVLFVNMWIGRLEVMTVLIFLQPEVWRLARWREFGHARLAAR